MEYALKPLFVDQYVELEDTAGNMLVGQISKIEDGIIEVGSIISKHRVKLSVFVAQELFVYFQGGAGDKYQFKSKVLSLSHINHSKLQLRMPLRTEILKVQKREHFRVATDVQFTLNLYNEEISEQEYRTADISGGGLSFMTTTDSFQVDDRLPGSLILDNGESQNSIPFVGRIVHIKSTSRRKRVAIEFIDIRESHRTLIIKFCMKEQLKRRKV